MQGFAPKSYWKVDFARNSELICRLLGVLPGFEGLIDHGADKEHLQQKTRVCQN